MSTIKSSAENLTLNADGANNDIKFQSNGVEVGSLTEAGVLTATSFAGSGASLTALPAANLTGTLPAIDGAALTNLPAGAELGSIIIIPTSTVPTNYLECNGATISRTTYADLFGVISDDYGVGDGSTTFEIPDLRGEFIRGWDNSASIDPDAASRTDRGDGTSGDVVGSKQGDNFKAHTHTIRSHSTAGNGAYQAASTGYSRPNPSNSAGGNETRPRNVAMMYCIKY